jgi:hypothetical protein
LARPFWLPVAARRHGLHAVTAVAVAVAQKVHAHKGLWHSTGDFLLAWFCGWYEVVFIWMCAGTLIAMSGNWFLGRTQSTTEPDIEQPAVYVMLTVLVLAVGYLLFHGWEPPDPYAVQEYF